MESKFKVNELITFTESVEGKYTQSDKGRIISIAEIPHKKNKKIIEYFYTVSSHGASIENVPESHLEHALGGTEQAIDDILSEKEKDKEYKDSDIRVGGSRKEKAAYRDLISGKDLEAIEKDPVLAKELVKKDKVYPKLIVANEIDKGVSGGAAYLKYVMRNLCGTYPPNTPEKRKFYVEFIAYMVTQVSDVLTVDGFKKETQNILNNVVSQAMLISKPELKEEIEKEKAELDELVDKKYEFQEKFDDIKGWFAKKFDNYNWWYEKAEHVNKAEKEHPEKYKEFLRLRNVLKTIENYNNSQILPIERTFLEQFGYKDLYRVRYYILEEMFGKKLAKFIYNSAYDYEDEAKKYEGLSEKESKEKIEKDTEYDQKKLAGYQEVVAFFANEDLTFKQKKEAAEKFNEKNFLLGYGIHKNNFGVNKPKHLYFKDVKDKPEFLDIWLEHILPYTEEAIEKRKESIKAVEEKYKVRDNDYSWAEGGKKGKHGERTDLVANSGLPLSYIKRDGGVAIYDEDINSDSNIKSFFKNVLGITRFEYGNYLPDKERLQHARHFSGAMLDMAEMLNWDVKEMIHLGDLGIKFASSGRGKAAAHYEPDRIAINLTRSAGDGSVSHEMAHYIDNMLAKLFPDENKTHQRHAPFGSYTEDYDGGRNISDNAIYEAMYNLMLFIRKGTINLKGEDAKQIDKLKELHVEYLKDRTIKIKVEANKSTPRYTYSLPETIEEWANQYTEGKHHWLNFENYKASGQAKKYIGAIVNWYDKKEYEFTFYLPKNTTVLYQFSSEMGSPYWSFAWELFARSFECYMFDKLAKLNRANNYLVSGGYFTRGESVYPQGIEREILFILYENLMLEIKKSLEIPDFKAFRAERADEYVSIDLKSEKEEESINVDAESKDVIDSSSEKVENQQQSIEQKLIKLYNILLTNRKTFETGGKITTFDELLEFV